MGEPAATEPALTVEALIDRHLANQAVLHRCVIRTTARTTPEQGQPGYGHLTASEYRRSPEHAQVIVPRFLSARHAPWAPGREPWDEMIDQINYVSSFGDLHAYRRWARPNDQTVDHVLFDDVREWVTNQVWEFSWEDVGAPLRGMSPDLHSVPDIIRKAGNSALLRPFADVIDGQSCHVVEARVPSGTYTVWFDPTRGFNILKLSVRRDWDSVYGDRPLWAALRGVLVEKLDDVSPSAADRSVSNEWTLSDVKLRLVSGTWLPVSGTVAVRSVMADGKVVESRTILTRETIDLNPNFEAIGAFRIDAPDGTPVYVTAQAHGVPYEWRQGKIVPRIDQGAATAIDTAVATARGDDVPGNASVIGSFAVEYWLWGVAALFAALIIGVAIVRRRHVV